MCICLYTIYTLLKCLHGQATCIYNRDRVIDIGNSLWIEYTEISKESKGHGQQVYMYIIEQHLDERPFSYFHHAYNVYETHVWFKIKTLEVTTHCMPTIPNKAFQI